MLAGEKKLAVFHDIVPEGGFISEEIIPEAAFAPYVANGAFKRFTRDIPNERSSGVLRFVCFTLPGEGWRAEFFLWLKREFFACRLEHSLAHDELIGKLLGYADEDIRDFLDRRS